MRSRASLPRDSRAASEPTPWINPVNMRYRACDVSGQWKNENVSRAGHGMDARQQARAAVFFHPDCDRRLRHRTGSADPATVVAGARGLVPASDGSAAPTAGGELHPALKTFAWIACRRTGRRSLSPRRAHHPSSFRRRSARRSVHVGHQAALRPCGVSGRLRWACTARARTAASAAACWPRPRPRLPPGRRHGARQGPAPSIHDAA